MGAVIGYPHLCLSVLGIQPGHKDGNHFLLVSTAFFSADYLSSKLEYADILRKENHNSKTNNSTFACMRFS